MAFGKLSQLTAALAVGCQIAVSTHALAGQTQQLHPEYKYTPPPASELELYDTQSGTRTAGGGYVPPTGAEYLRSYNEYADGYNPGEESHAKPGDRRDGWFATNMITYNYAMENGWYANAVKKVIDPRTGQIISKWIDPAEINKYFKAGTAYVNQNIGLAYLRLKHVECDASANKCTYAGGSASYDLVFDPSNSTLPVVFAKYDPATYTGVINVQRIQKMDNGDLLVVQKRFDPRDGGPDVCMKDQSILGGCLSPKWGTALYPFQRPDLYGFANKFGYNPFQEFEDPQHPDQWTNITAEAFYAVVAALVIQQKARAGWIANMITREELRKKKSGNAFRKKVKYTINAYTKPRWTLVTPPNVPIPNAAHYGFRTSRGDNFTLGYSAFVRHQGKHATLPQQEILSYTYSKTYKAWTGLAMFVFSAVFAAFTFGVGSWLAGTGAVAQGGAGAISNAVLGGAMQGAAGEMLGAALVGGGLNAAWNASVGVDFNDPANKVFASGKKNLDIDSLPGKFDWRKGVQAKMIGSDPGQNLLYTPGATGQLFRDRSLHHKEHFVSGFNLSPEEALEYSNRRMEELALELDQWLQDYRAKVGTP